jgi:hypothetical protein
MATIWNVYLSLVQHRAINDGQQPLQPLLESTMVEVTEQTAE